MKLIKPLVGVVIFGSVIGIGLLYIVRKTSVVNDAGEVQLKQDNTVPMINQLLVEDIAVGNGNAVESGDTVVIHYEGKLQTGEVFDSSYTRGKPFETAIGMGRVIKGWDEGVIGMKKGGKRKLTIPPDKAYGPQGVPGAIPPNATLIFTLELLDIKGR